MKIPEPFYPPALLAALKPIRRRLAEIVAAMKRRPKDRRLWRQGEQVRLEMIALAALFHGEGGAL